MGIRPFSRAIRCGAAAAGRSRPVSACGIGTRSANLVSEVIRNRLGVGAAAGYVAAWVLENVDAADRARFQEIAETELMGLHEGNYARYRVFVRPVRRLAGRVGRRLVERTSGGVRRIRERPRCAKLRDAQSPSSQPNHQQQQQVGIDVDAAMHDLSDARNLTVPDGLNGTVSVADANHLVSPAW